MDLGGWLRRLGLEQYEAAFRENDIDDTILPHLTAEELKDLGVGSVGHRHKLLGAIAALRAEAGGSTPLSDVPLASDKAANDTAERRQVTVMFADLVGSTALSARMDPEDLREIISAYQRCVADSVRRFGGFVAKYLGDGVLIYFGYPAAHEDDVERAVRAGLAVIDAVATLKAPQPVQVRIGVATGMVVVGDLVGSGEAQERGIVGETPNLAARLQGIAAPNTVVIAEATRRLLGNLFELRDLGPKELKGIAGPVRAFAALRASSVESRFEAMHPDALTALVGRDEELELLLRRWSRAKTGEGQVVLISSESGIGKSRVCAALIKGLTAEPHTRLRYFCSPQHTDSAFYPIIGQLERAAGLAHDDTPRTKLDKLDALLAQTATSEHDAALLAEMLSLPNDGRYPALELAPEQRRQQTLEALGVQLETLARSSIVEDAHWADPTSLEAFGRLVDRIVTLRVLLIVTFRPEFEASWVGQPHVTALGLNRLGHRDVGTLIDRVVGNKPLPANLRKDIIERTDGIPLFVEEMTKAVLEAGGELEAMQMAAAPSMAVPASLHASLMERLDRLGPAKELAQTAAAIGREFSHALLAAVVREPEAELGSSLDRLIRAGLLFRKGVPPHAIYLFKHALVQDAAYGTLLRQSRRALHRRIAEILETQFPEAATAQPEVLAQHCAEAGLKEQAVPYLQRAGARALERSAYLEAISHLARGLELLEASPDSTERAQRELELQLALGSALMATRGYAAPEVEQAYVRARALCSHIGLTPQLFPVLHGLYRIYHVRGDLIAAREVGEQLTELGQSLGDQTLLMEAHRALGVPLIWLGEVALARAKLEEGIAIYDAKLVRSHAYTYGIDPGVVCLSYAALAWWFLGFADHALDRSQRALALAEELSHPHSRALALVWAAWLRQFRREVPSTQELAQAAIRLCSEHGYPLWRPMGAILHGWALSESGQKPEERIAQMRQGLADLRATGAGLWQPCFLALIAEACSKVNRIDEGLTVLDQALGVVRERAERFYEAELHRLRGELLLRCNPAEISASETCFQTAIAIARNQQARSLELRAATSLARLWIERGERRNAQDLLTGIWGWFTEGFDTLDLKEAKSLLDELT